MCKPFRKIQFCTIVGLIVLWVATPTAGQEPSLTLTPLFDGTRVLVLPFRNISGDPSTDWVGAGIAEAVAADLPPTTEVVLLDADQVPPEAGDTLEAAAAGRRAGARWAIHGGYQQVGTQLRITARVIDCETGAVARSARIDGSVSYTHLTLPTQA